jgi:hypothetical protein
MTVLRRGANISLSVAEIRDRIKNKDFALVPGLYIKQKLPILR